MKYILISVSLILFMMALVACNGAGPQNISHAGNPQSWIDAPQNGSSLPLAPTQIVSHSTSAASIAKVELSVNGVIVHTDANQGATQTLVVMNQAWTPVGPGNYRLQVRALDNAGNWGDYADAVVTVGGGTPTRTTTPTPASTPTTLPSATPTNLPNVTIRFTVDDTSLFVGECANLNWAVTNASQVLLDNAPVNLTGTKQVCPRLTTVYKLHITTLDRQITERTLTIAVTAAPTRTFTSIIPTRTPTLVPVAGCSGAPVISTFAASLGTINAGGTSILTWGVVTNADSVELDHGIGGVGAPGQATVSPSSTTTYVLTARCKGTPTTRQVTIVVNAAPAGPTIGTPTFSSTGIMYSDSSTCSPARGTSVRVAISASDPNGVIGVTIYHRYANSTGSPATSYSSNAMTSGGVGNWSFTLSAPSSSTVPYTNGWVQFYFVAVDSGGATTRSPDYNNNVSLINCDKP